MSPDEQARKALRRMIGDFDTSELSDEQVERLFVDIREESWLDDARTEMLEAVARLYLTRRGYVVPAKEDRPACPGPGWEWDAFAKRWRQPGAKGPAIAASRSQGA